MITPITMKTLQTKVSEIKKCITVHFHTYFYFFNQCKIEIKHKIHMFMYALRRLWKSFHLRVKESKVWGPRIENRYKIQQSLFLK